MKEFQFVNVDQIKNHQHYGALLLSNLNSLRTMKKVETTAYLEGLLTQEELEEHSRLICCELDRLWDIYIRQIETLMDICDLDKESICASLQKLTIPLKKTRKKKNQ